MERRQSRQIDRLYVPEELARQSWCERIYRSAGGIQLVRARERMGPRPSVCRAAGLEVLPGGVEEGEGQAG
eukprot:7431707-Lingulodinium_polyedra.AAC.1